MVAELPPDVQRSSELQLLTKARPPLRYARSPLRVAPRVLQRSAVELLRLVPLG